MGDRGKRHRTLAAPVVKAAVLAAVVLEEGLGAAVAARVEAEKVEDVVRGAGALEVGDLAVAAAVRAVDAVERADVATI